MRPVLTRKTAIMVFFGAALPPLTLFVFLSALDRVPRAAELPGLLLSYLVGLGPAVFTGFMYWWLRAGGFGRFPRIAGVAATHALAPLPIFLMLTLLSMGDAIYLHLWFRCIPVFAASALVCVLFADFVWPGPGLASRLTMKDDDGGATS